jgi:hypothetical protein
VQSQHVLSLLVGDNQQMQQGIDDILESKSELLDRILFQRPLQALMVIEVDIA